MHSSSHPCFMHISTHPSFYPPFTHPSTQSHPFPTHSFHPSTRPHVHSSFLPPTPNLLVIQSHILPFTHSSDTCFATHPSIPSLIHSNVQSKPCHLLAGSLALKWSPHIHSAPTSPFSTTAARVSVQKASCPASHLLPIRCQKPKPPSPWG